MVVAKFREFDEELAAALVTDIQYALAGVALKHKVELIVGEMPKISDGEVFMGLQAKMINTKKSDVPGFMAALQSALTTPTSPKDRIEGFVAALPEAHAEYFPHLSLKANYRNGDHTYAIVGYNSRAREHKLLMQNVKTGEYSRMPISTVSKFQRVRAKRSA